MMETHPFTCHLAPQTRGTRGQCDTVPRWMLASSLTEGHCCIERDLG
jgi:hypothetical protein